MGEVERPDRREDAASLRPLLFSIAYGMTGEVHEAEDLVQEALVRVHAAGRDGVEVRSPKAFASAIVTRLAIDRSRSARAQRERYVGEWLPEPVVVDLVADPGASAELNESLSVALLVVLERLSPVERAVFLLKDVFGFPHDEVAELLGMSAVNSRQVAARARRRVSAGAPRFGVSESEHQTLAERFVRAARAGDVGLLAGYLSADVQMSGDGGGRAPALRGTLRGRHPVARAAVAFARQSVERGSRFAVRSVNGTPGILRLDDGKITAVVALEFRNDQVIAVRSVLNPAKLQHLGPIRP